MLICQVSIATINRYISDLQKKKLLYVRCYCAGYTTNVLSFTEAKEESNKGNPARVLEGKGGLLKFLTCS